MDAPADEVVRRRRKRLASVDRSKAAAPGPGLPAQQLATVQQPSSLKAQARFLYTLGVLATISVFTLAPRAAFEDPSVALDAIQECASASFGLIYMMGANHFRRHQELRRQRGIGPLESHDHAAAQSPRVWSISALDHPANITMQVILASVVPVACDTLSFILRPDSKLSRMLVICPGSLRLLHLLGFTTLFRALDMNLTVPHYPVFLVKSCITLLFSVHYAACSFWALARSDDFSEHTWVGAQMPELKNTTLSRQYIYSVYWSSITASTVGYGDFSPVSESECALTIVYVLINVIIVAKLVGGISALAAMADQEMARQRATIRNFELMLTQEQISGDVVDATREYLRMRMHTATADIDQLPIAVQMQIREQRFYGIISGLPIMQGLSRRFIAACVNCVSEDTFVAGLDIIRTGDVPNRLSIILDGYATIQYPSQVAIANQESDQAAPVQTGNETTHRVATLVPGACFGAEGFISSVPTPWSVTALTLLRTISLSETDRAYLQRAFPSDYFKLHANLATALCEMEEVVLDVAQRLKGGSSRRLRSVRDGEDDRAIAQSLFEEIDADNSGGLDLEEIKLLSHRLGVGLNDAQLAEAITEIDVDNSGEIDFEEFFTWYTGNQASTPGSSLTRSRSSHQLKTALSKSRSSRAWQSLQKGLQSAVGLDSTFEQELIIDLSKRTKCHHTHTWIEPAQVLTSPLVQAFAEGVNAVKIEVVRTQSRASHELAGLVCHNCAKGDEVELERYATLRYGSLWYE